MKKIILFFFLLFVLSACAPAADVTSTPVPTADLSLATPLAGWVVVDQRPGAKSAHVFAAPDAKAAILGDVEIGAGGTLEGVNATGDWVLVKFDQLTGWMPTLTLIITSEY